MPEEERRRDFKEIWQTMARTEQKVDTLTALISPRIKDWDSASTKINLLLGGGGLISLFIVAWNFFNK